MPGRISPLRCLAVAMALVSCTPAPAQSLNDGMDALNKKRTEHKTLISGLFRGEVPLDPKEPVHMEAVDVASKLITYPYILEVPDKTAGAIDKLFRNFETDIIQIQRGKDKTQELSKVYAELTRKHALEVLQHPTAKPIIRIAAARVLAHLAVLGQPEMVDTLVALAKETKQNEGVRYFAFRGLKEILSLPPTPMGPVLDNKRIASAAEAIIEFLARPAPVSTQAPADEIEGYRLLRREAVRALAQVQLPLLSDKLRPALVLARFAGNDERIQPAPRLDERLEAAIGLARMRPSKQVPNYQLDYAYEQIGIFVAFLGTAANLNVEASDDRRIRPWKVDAQRLIDVINAAKNDAKDPYMVRIADASLRVLAPITRRNKAQAADLTMLGENKAPTQELFKGQADTTVKSAQATPPTLEKPTEPSEK